MRRHLLIGFLIGPLLIGILVLWLATTETAMQWAARRVTAASGGKIAVTGVTGSLASTLRVGHIEHRTEERVVTVRNAELTWSPAQLLFDRIAIDSLSAEAVTVETLRASDKPPQLPQRLALPLDLRIDRARIGTLALVSGGGRTELSDLHLRLDADKESWRLPEFGFETAFGAISGSGTLSTARPYPVDGRVRLRGTDARADAALGGDLAALRVEADFEGWGGNGAMNALAAPFDALPLRSLRLNARGVDPSRVRKGWPRADLRLDVDGAIGEGGSLRGALAFANPLAGQLDKGLLPLRAAQARLGGTLDAARLDNVVLDFGPAGRFAGTGAIAGKDARLALHTGRFDLRGISSRLNSTAISGDVVLTQVESGQMLDARLGQDGLRLDLNAVRQGDLVRLREAVLRARGGEASASGETRLAGERSFQLQARMRRFNPAAFGKYPSADLNLDVVAQGRLAPQWQVSARYDFQPSRLNGQPLTGSGRFEADARHVRDVDATLALGPNRATARGNFGLPGDRLKWMLDAPRLESFGNGYRGSVRGEGELGGTMEAPRLTLELAGRNLALAGHAVRMLRASASVGESEHDPLKLDVLVEDAESGGMQLKAASVRVDGTRARHDIRLSARNEDVDLTAQAAGGWHQGSGWEGVIGSMNNAGTYGFALQSPAPLRVGAAGDASLRDFALALSGGGRISIDVLERTGGRLETRGSARALPLASLTALYPAMKDGIDTDLMLGADWSVTAAETVDGSVRVFRESGDVILRRQGDLKLGLTALAARVVAERNVLRAELTADGERVGSIRANAGAQLARQGGGWTLPMSSPLRLQATADMPSLAWLGPLSGNPGIEAGGRLSLDVSANGTVGSPRLSGSIYGDELALTWAEQGIKLHGGVLRAQLAGDSLKITQAVISGDEGSLRIEGGARMAGRELLVDMRLVAEKLLLLARPDRVLAVSGEGALSLDQNRLQLSGKFQADRARIEFPEGHNVTVSEDVVVLGEESAEKAGKSFPVRYDLELGLGRNFNVRGKGIEARLAGSVRVFSVPEDRLPRAQGTIRVAEGTYEAYGQKLAIERGFISFNGPINNPGLDILAVRKPPNVEGAVEAGVQLRGTALAPVARLVSTPSVSDTEKLSWLVLGKGTEQAAGQEFNVLASAAAALLSTSQAESLQSRLASTFGIDEFGVTNAMGVEGAVVTLGKRISSRVYLAFEQGVTGATSLVKLRYVLSRRLTVEVGTGTATSVDIVYNWRFD